ncbi:MAG: amidohydrolase [Pseudomonadota bacterium]
MSSTLFTNGIIVTVDPAMTVHWPGCLLVENGTITAIGSGEPETTADETIDLAGDIVMPGMVNTHCHLAMSLFRGLGDDEPNRLKRYIFPLEKRFVSPEMVRIGSLLAGIELAEGGVTTVADMYYFETEVGRALEMLGMRGVVGQTIVDFDAPDAPTTDDGFALFDRLAAEFQDHPTITPSIAPHAPYTTGLEILRRVNEVSEASRAPVQIHLAEMDFENAWVRKHCDGSPVDLLEQAGLLRYGVVAAHCLWVEPRDIANLARGRVAVAHNAGANVKGGRGIAPVLDMLAAGVTVGLGSDGPMSGNTIDLFAQMSQVAKLQKLRAKDRTVMSAQDVVLLATIGGARTLGLDDKIGSLEVGKQADIVRVRRDAARLHPLHDPYAALVYAAIASDVRDVMVAGRFIVRDGRVENVDRAGILSEAGALADRMREALS